MRIAIAHYSNEHDIGGVSTWLIHLVRHLRRQDWPVAVHLLHSGRHPENSTILPALQDADAAIVLHQQQEQPLANVRLTLAFLNDWQPSVFLPQCSPTHFMAADLAGRQGLPWALTVHSDDPQYWAVLTVVRPFRSNGRTVCVSRYLADEVRRRGYDPSPLVIPCGVPWPVHPVRQDPEVFHVVYCGRVVEEQKRITLVLRSLILACQASSQIKATIIGDGNALEACRRQVQAAGLAGAIRFTGRVAPGEVAQLLSAAQAILLMSDYEGLPVALMEAMALGVVPVARTIASGIPELVQHERTGLLVSDDPSEAAAAILRLAADPHLWQRCSSASRALVHRTYRLDGTMKLWTDLIEERAGDSRLSYPIRNLSLPLATQARLSAIRVLWGAPQRRAAWRQRRRTLTARFKHGLKQLLS